MINPTTGKPPVILVVEDEVLTRMEIADILTDAGFRVIAEVNADHALTVLNTTDLSPWSPPVIAGV